MPQMTQRKTGRRPVLMKYTSLSAAIHILRAREIALLDPSHWDDKNDAYAMRRYAERMGRGHALATCFTQARDTYHHWRVFAGGTDGVRVEFDKTRLLAAVEADPDVVTGEMTYLEIAKMQAGDALTPADLAFIKRLPYSDEREFRIVKFAKESRQAACPIALSWVRRVTLSPWMAAPLAASVKATLKEIPGCAKLRVYQSTLVGNADWRSAADRIAGGDA